MADKEKDGRLVATSAINLGGTSYQKGEYVDTTNVDKEEVQYYAEQGVLWTETQWIGKYKTEPVEHEDPKGFPPPAGAPLTSAEMAAKVQESNPALRREGDTRVETTTSGQTPEQRKTVTGDGQAAGTDKTGDGPAADARKVTGGSGDGKASSSGTKK